MTPDLTARIEELARECSLILRNSPGYVIERNRGVSINEVDEEISGVVAESLSTLAASIIAEKDAEAAALREALEEICDESTCNCEDYWTKRDRHDPSCPCGINMTAHAALAAFTAGRDLLSERDSLRERVRELEKHNAMRIEMNER